MPFIETEGEVQPDVLQVEPEAKAAETGFGEAFGSAFPANMRQTNSVVNAYNFMRRPQSEPEPDYDPFSDIQGYEDHAQNFIMARSHSDVAGVKARIDQENLDRETIRASGWAGMAGTLAAGAMDPLLLVPFTGGLRLGESALSAGLATARNAALGLTAQEALLQATQETRPLAESVTNVAAGTLLSGILGAVIGPKVGARVAKDFEIPKAADPLQPGAIRITPEELASDTDSSVGARATVRTDAKLKSAFGAENVLRQTSPGLRLATSGDVETRRVAQQLVETPFTYEENALGLAPEPAVETLVKMHQAPLAHTLQDLDNLYVQYRTGAAGGRAERLKLQATDLVNKTEALSFGEFRAQVGRAMRREDEHAIPEVAQAAKNFREKVFDPLKDKAVQNKQIPEDISTETAASYLSRVWNINKIRAQRNDFVSRVVSWLKFGQEAAASKADEASQQFASLEHGELEDIANQIIRTLSGTPGGRIHYDAIPVAIKRAPALKERTFNIPDVLIEDYLEDDISFIARRYVHTMAPDVEIAKRFGSADMAEQVKKIQDSYDKKSSALPDGSRERKAVEAQRDADLRDLGAMRDRLRGNYAVPSDPNSLLSRTTTFVKNWNYLRLMGGMTVSSLSDLARPGMTQGLGRLVNAGLVPMMRNLKAVRLSMNEVKRAGTALDMVLGSRAQALADLGDDFGHHSKFERGVQASTQMFGTLALMNPWNAAMKQFTGVLVQDRILSDVTSTSARAIEKLAASRIDSDMAQRIARQFAAFGEEVDGTKIANTHLWDDPYAVEAYRAAIVRDVDRAIVTPGVGDRPLMASRLLGSPELAQLVFQFRGFTFAAMQKVLIAGLQDRDAATLNGLVLSVALGSLTYYIKTLQAGKTPSDDPLVWLSEGVDRSGVTSSLFDINSIVEKATRGAIGINALRGGPQMSKYASRSLVNAILGPSIGTLEDLATTTGALSTGEMSEANKRAMLRLIPAQNLFYLRSLLDAAAEDDTPR